MKKLRAVIQAPVAYRSIKRIITEVEIYRTAVDAALPCKN
jgi:hypothetical protein